MCFFGGGGFLVRAIDQILSRVDLRFFLPPSLLLSALISTKPSQRCIRVPGHHSWSSRFPILFFFFFISILPIRTYNPIFRDAERRERESKKRKKKEKNELPRVCRIRTKTYTHTYLLRYVHTYCWFQPPVRIQKNIVYLLPTYLPT